MRITQMFFLLTTLLSLPACSHTTLTTADTKVSTWTFFDGKSDLTKVRVSQTDKTQSVSLGAMASESSGSNVVTMFERGIGAAVKAGVEAAKP